MRISNEKYKKCEVDCSRKNTQRTKNFEKKRKMNAFNANLTFHTKVSQVFFMI